MSNRRCRSNPPFLAFARCVQNDTVMKLFIAGPPTRTVFNKKFGGITNFCEAWAKRSLSVAREVILQFVEKITVHPDRIEIGFAGLADPVTVSAALIRCSGETRVATASENWPSARLDASLIKLIVRAHQTRMALANPANGSLTAAASSLGLSTQYFCRLLRLGYLAPDITVAILDGRRPARVNRQFLARINDLPIGWVAQREMLGFA
jgi:hypothetical protein